METTSPPRVTLIQPDGTFDVTREVLDPDFVGFADCALVIGDPADLYVCCDRCLAIEATGLAKGDPSPHAHAYLTAIVTGSSAPAVELEAETLTAIRELRWDHLPESESGPEFIYHEQAYQALRSFAFSYLRERASEAGAATLWSLALLGVVVPLVTAAVAGLHTVAAALGAR